jgi:type I restriction enzyme, S subunit
MSRAPWPMVRLEEVLRQASDPSNVSADQEYPNFGIYSFGRGLFRKPPISGTTTSARTLYRARRGRFIYSRLFAFEGAYGVVPDDLDGSYVSNEYPMFDADPGRLLPNYLAAYFQLPRVWEEVAKSAVGMGDRRRRVQPDQFLEHSIPLPPLAEQRRIVAKLDQLSAKVDEAQKLRRQSRTDTRAMLLGAFSRCIRSARWQQMSQVAPLVRRPVEVDAMATYPELGVRSFGKGTFHKPALAGIEVGAKKLFEIHPGDLVFNNVFAWEGAVAVAREEDANRFGSHRFITCVPLENVATPHFLCFYFLTDQGLDDLGKASPGGAGRNRTLGLDALSAIRVPVPPASEQRSFDRLRASANLLALSQDSADREIEAILPASIDRAFKGKL